MVSLSESHQVCFTSGFDKCIHLVGYGGRHLQQLFWETWFHYGTLTTWFTITTITRRAYVKEFMNEIKLKCITLTCWHYHALLRQMYASLEKEPLMVGKKDKTLWTPLTLVIVLHLDASKNNIQNNCTDDVKLNSITISLLAMLGWIWTLRCRSGSIFPFLNSAALSLWSNIFLSLSFSEQSFQWCSWSCFRTHVNN